MEITSISDNTWKELLTTDKKFEFKSLALRVLLSRLKIKIQLSTKEDKEKNIEQCVLELKDFFKKLNRLPSVQYDLSLIGGV